MNVYLLHLLGFENLYSQFFEANPLEVNALCLLRIVREDADIEKTAEGLFKGA